MQSTPILRLDIEDQAAIARYFADGAPCPVILTGAMHGWSALENWTLERLAALYGGDFGSLWFGFHGAACRKVTSLGEFIAHLDTQLETIPGFWLDADGKPLRTAPEVNPDEVWSFVWNGLEQHKHLWAEILPYPAAIPNLTANLPRDLYDLMQGIWGHRFHEIYVSRKGTITPLHRDYSSTFGSIAQFDGRKLVMLIAPDEHAQAGGPAFDPEQADFDRFPQMRDATIFRGELDPGELLLIPPDWWHYTRSLEHAVILSHNFFSPLNFNAYMRAMFFDLTRWGEDDGLARKIANYLPVSNADQTA